MREASYYINHLQLQKHPEGGYYKETYRSVENIAALHLPERFTGARSFSTAIYYLLEQGDFSAFHRIKSDECWHFYSGGTLLVHVLDVAGHYYRVALGQDLEAGEVLQFVVPAGAWFASQPAKDVAFSLVGCTVAPGFDFEDFEMANKEELGDLYPQHVDIISSLCR